LFCNDPLLCHIYKIILDNLVSSSIPFGLGVVTACPQTLKAVSRSKEVNDMLMGSWAKRTFSKETLTFALSVASLFLVLGLLFYWVHLALQSP
jgi:hypothetical protein